MRPLVPLLLAAAGLIALGAAERLLTPPTVALADVGRHEGARVAVEGWVTTVRAGGRGSYLELADGESRLGLLVGGPPPVLPGTLARAVGVVGRDGVAFVLSAERITALDAPRAPRTVGDVLDHLSDGAPVVARGTHVRGALRDGDAGLPLRFPDEPASEGPLVVSGVLRLDRARAAWRLEVGAWTQA